MIEFELRTLLLTDATLQSKSVEILPHRGNDLEPGANYILYSVISGEMFDDRLDEPNGQQEKRIQYEVWSESYVTCREIAEALKSLLHHYSGTLGQFNVEGIFHASERETTSALDEAKGTFVYGVQADFMVIYE